MTLEVKFTQEQLEKLAELLAKHLNNQPQSILFDGKGNRFDNMTIREVLSETNLSMSTRLYSMLNRAFPGYTMKQLAGVRWKNYKRVSGMVAKIYDELCRFFDSLGYQPGYNLLKYDYDKQSFYIEER